MKVYLDQTYLWNRREYGPGETEIPDGLAIAIGLDPTKSATKPENVADLETETSTELSTEPEAKPKTTRRK